MKIGLPADIARCEGREADHPYYRECEHCLRKTSPPHERSIWIIGWGGHGECPDKLDERPD